MLDTQKIRGGRSDLLCREMDQYTAAMPEDLNLRGDAIVVGRDG